MMTQEEFLKIASKLNTAEEDDTPFLVVKDDEIAVVGDANKTERKKRNYVLKFRFPLSDDRFRTDDCKIVGKFYIAEIEFTDVCITPRKDLEIVAAGMKIIPYFKKLREDGSIENRNNDELFEIFANMSTEILDAIYTFVGSVLGISGDLIDKLLPTSALVTLNLLIEDYPEIFNEADVFFG